MNSKEYFLDFGPHFLDARTESTDKTAIKILGIPYDNGVSFRKGARLGPARIRFMSHSLETYSPTLRKDLADLEYYDLGDLAMGDQDPNDAGVSELNDFAPNQAADLIFNNVKDLVGNKLVIIGGDHSISVPVIKAYHQLYPDLHVIQVDSHLDYRDEYENDPYSHACPMRRVRDMLGEKRIVQLGYRSCPREEERSAYADGLYVSKELRLPDEIRESLSGKPVYLSIDMDVLDLASAPGVGVPEPGGPSFHELMNLLYSLSELDIKAFDVVEVSPPFDPSDITSVTAAKVIRELILSYFRVRPPVHK